MSLGSYNLPPGVTLRDLDGPEDLDDIAERLARNADEARERAEDAEIQRQIDSAPEGGQADRVNMTNIEQT